MTPSPSPSTPPPPTKRRALAPLSTNSPLPKRQKGERLSAVSAVSQRSSAVSAVSQRLSAVPAVSQKSEPEEGERVSTPPRESESPSGDEDEGFRVDEESSECSEFETDESDSESDDGNEDFGLNESPEGQHRNDGEDDEKKKKLEAQESEMLQILINTCSKGSHTTKLKSAVLVVVTKLQELAVSDLRKEIFLDDLQSRLTKWTAEQLSAVMYEAFLPETIALCEKESWTADDFRELVSAVNDEQQGIYLNVLIKEADNELQGCYTGSSNLIQRRIKEHLGKSRKMKEYREKLDQGLIEWKDLPGYFAKHEYDLHYRRLWESGISPLPVTLAHTDKDLPTPYLHILEGICTLIFGTLYVPKQDSQVHNKATARAFEKIRGQLDLASVPQWERYNRASQFLQNPYEWSDRRHQKIDPDRCCCFPGCEKAVATGTRKWGRVKPGDHESLPKDGMLCASHHIFCRKNKGRDPATIGKTPKKKEPGQTRHCAFPRCEKVEGPDYPGSWNKVPEGSHEKIDSNGWLCASHAKWCRKYKGKDPATIGKTPKKKQPGQARRCAFPKCESEEGQNYHGPWEGVPEDAHESIRVDGTGFLCGTHSDWCRKNKGRDPATIKFFKRKEPGQARRCAFPKCEREERRNYDGRWYAVPNGAHESIGKGWFCATHEQWCRRHPGARPPTA